MDVSMDYTRRPEDLAKPEGLPERPPAPDPEGQPYNNKNIDAVAANSDSNPPPSLPSIPSALSTVTVVEPSEIPQPLPTSDDFAEPSSDLQSLPAKIESTVIANGEVELILPMTNGAMSGQSNGQLSSPPSTSLPEAEVATVSTDYQAPSSAALPITSFESTVPSSAQIGTQDTLISSAPDDSLQSLPDLPLSPGKAPISNLRSSPHPVPQDSEAAIRIRQEKREQDIASDPELAQSLAAPENEQIERNLPGPAEHSTPSPSPAPAPQSTMDTSSDAPDQPATVTAPTSIPSPVPPKLEPDIVPAAQPQAPTPPPVTAPPLPQSPVDQPMLDVADVPVKVSREREAEDEEDGPASKRLKAEAETSEPEFKVPDVPAQSTQAEPSTMDAPAHTDDSVTAPRLSHMKKVIANLKKSASSKNFREPVDTVRFNIPQYLDIVKQPMDLGTVDKKLKSNGYEKVSDFVAEFQLIVTNAILFNGTEHTVTQEGLKMRSSFDNQMKALPPPDFAIITKEEKKTAKAKEHPLRTTQRRASASQAAATVSGRSPVTPGSAQTFALGPEGVPLIRRDSVAADGRPKRAIHPPKRREQEFGPGRPRKKKFEWQLKFCKDVLNELKKGKHQSYAQYFNLPVDAVALNIPTYHKVIKKPMDLDTVEKKLDSNQYERAKEFEEDVRQIFKNCYAFNAPGDFVHTCGQQLEKAFDEKWATKDDWLSSHEPASEPQSAGEDGDDDVEASEEDDDDSSDDRTDEIAQLKAQIAMMSATIGSLQVPKKKKKNTPPAPANTKKGTKSKKKEKLGNAPSLQQSSKEKKKSSKSKPEKEHFVTYNEKQYISTGISSLTDARMSEALKIIQNNVPALKNTHETEIELDIDELPNHVLLKLLSFVKKHGEQSVPEPAPVTSSYGAVSPLTPSKPKKNKPMSKHEQEQQINKLQGQLGRFADGQGGLPTARSVEKDGESSGDDDSEESEEE